LLAREDQTNSPISADLYAEAIGMKLKEVGEFIERWLVKGEAHGGKTLQVIGQKGRFLHGRSLK